MVTVSLIKADIGGLVGHSSGSEEIIKLAKRELEKAKKKKAIIDYHCYYVGDDLQLLLTHNKGENNKKIHELAWNIFKKASVLAKKLKLYGYGQDLLKDTFSGNLKGLGPGYAEIEFEERKSEPLLVFAADKTDAGAWNLPLYKIFSDPFNTAGLVIDKKMRKGFYYEIWDIRKGKKIILKSPEEIYDILALIGSTGRYVVKRIYNSEKEKVAVTSTSRLDLIANRYVGKDDPVMIIRCQHGFPAVGEVLEAFATPFLVEGWMRGSFYGPLLPVKLKNAKCSRFDGPPIVTCLGFQLVNGKLTGKVDMFDNSPFDYVREKVNELASAIRKQGIFVPHRKSEEEMEYTTLPIIEEKLKGRWEKIE